MAATALIAEQPSSKGEGDLRRELLISLARILGLAYGVIASGYALMLLLDPSLWEVVSLVDMLLLAGVCYATVRMARSQRQDLAVYFLLGGITVVVALGGIGGYWAAVTARTAVPTGASVSVFAYYVVVVVLAGILLPRLEVLGLTGIITLLSLFQVGLSRVNYALPLASEVEMLGASIITTLSFLLMMSLLVSEYSRRLGQLLALSDQKAKDLEVARAHAVHRTQELEQAKAELERRMAELAAAKEEIERKRAVGLTAAARIHEMARELAAAAAQQASGSSQQAAAMGEIVATMEELGRAAGQIAGNSVQVSQLASATLHSAGSGRDAVEETIAALDRIRGEMRAVAEKNLALGQKTQAIGEIIEVITEIADRTHLLSLNAAIESAAAGEYGRRFSVVASQVKELANESKNAAHQVRAAVAEIQRASASTVLAAEKGETEVEAGVRLGRGAGESIAQMVASIEDVAAAAKEMLLATQQQQSASEQVVSTVREIEQVTRQAAEGNRQTSQAVSLLVGVAEQLQ